MSDELIVNLAPTGMVPTRADSPHVPLTPDEVAADVRRCRDAGRLDRPPPPARRARRADPVARPGRGVHRGGPRGRPGHRRRASRRAAGATPSSTARAAVLDLDGPVRPEMASLTLGSLNFPKQASVNAPATIAGLAERMRDRGIVPEWEVFDFGMLDYAAYLRGRGLLGDPVYVNLLLGSLGTRAATPLNLALLVERLPAGATWAATGIGRFQFADEPPGDRDGRPRPGRPRGQPLVRRRPDRPGHELRGSSSGSSRSAGPWAASRPRRPRSGRGSASRPAEAPGPGRGGGGRPRPQPTWTPKTPRAVTPEQDGVEHDDEADRGPGEDVAAPAVGVAAHQPPVVDEQDHEDEDDRQQQALEVLRGDDDRQSGRVPGMSTTSAPMTSTNV